jgi:hypothetical protein
MQHAKRMRRFIFSAVVWPYHGFPHYLINGTIFLKKVIESKMRVMIFSAVFV